MFESIKSVLFIAHMVGRHADDMFLYLLRVKLCQTTPFQQSKALQQTALSLHPVCFKSFCNDQSHPAFRVGGLALWECFAREM